MSVLRHRSVLQHMWALRHTSVLRHMWWSLVLPSKPGLLHKLGLHMSLLELRRKWQLAQYKPPRVLLHTSLALRSMLQRELQSMMRRELQSMLRRELRSMLRREQRSMLRRAPPQEPQCKPLVQLHTSALHKLLLLGQPHKSSLVLPNMWLLVLLHRSAQPRKSPVLLNMWPPVLQRRSSSAQQHKSL
jgi:hypothetical protein